MSFSMNILKETNLKLKIFSDLDQVELFSKYLGINSADIDDCLMNLNLKISNPMRKDNTPSLGFRWIIDKETNREKIRMYDFGDSFWRGDIIDLAGKVRQLTVQQGSGFVQACKDIIKVASTNTIINNIKHKPKVILRSEATLIAIEIREFNRQDLSFWKSKGFDKQDLIKGNVIAVNTAWVNSEDPTYRYHKDDICYAYYLGKIENVNRWKLYFINRGRNGDKRARFITNNTLPLEGLHEIVPSDVLVITKSRADKLLLSKMFDDKSTLHPLFSTGELTIHISNFTSETSRLSEPLATWLKRRFTYIFVNNDFDREGIRGALYHLQKYDMQPIFLTNGRFNTHNYEAKDITDYVRNNGYNNGLLLLNETIDRLYEEVKTIDNYFIQNTYGEIGDITE